MIGHKSKLYRVCSRSVTLSWWVVTLKRVTGLFKLGCGWEEEKNHIESKNNHIKSLNTTKHITMHRLDILKIGF